MGFIDKAWQKQELFEIWLKKRWKRVKERRKQKLKGKTLVPLDDVVWLRNGLFYVAIGCLIPGVINVFTHWFDFEDSPCISQFGMRIPYCEDPPKPIWAGLEVYGWFLFIFIGGCALFVDYCVYKRGGEAVFFSKTR